jgi:hypothetical protein
VILRHWLASTAVSATVAASRTVGTAVATPVSATIGAAVATLVGAAVATLVGAAVSATIGTAVSATIGAAVANRGDVIVVDTHARSLMPGSTGSAHRTPR